MFESAGTLELEFMRWGARLDAMVARAEKAGDDAEGGLRLRIEDLQAKREAVQVKLEELRAAGEGKWEILEEGLEAAWRELENAFAKMSD